MRLHIAAFAFAAALLNTPATAAPANVAAAVAAKDRPAAMVKLDEGRRPIDVLNFLCLEKGDRVLDLMPGAGYYTEIMARAVGPKGSVLAVEPPQFLSKDEDKAAWTALRERTPNARLQLQLPKNLTLAPASIDLAMLHLVYHDMYWESPKYSFPRHDPDTVLAEVFRAMKPGGIVGVADHTGTAGIDTRALVEKLHRIDPAVVRADFERAGFVFDGETDLLRIADDDMSKSVFDPAIRGKTDRFLYRFKKPASTASSVCNAARAEYLVGTTLTDTSRDAAMVKSGARAVRAYRTGDMLTMDYREDRLNIESGEDGKVVKVNCG